MTRRRRRRLRSRAEWRREREEVVMRGWANMYVSGRWTLAELERHLDAMLPHLLGKAD